MRKDNDVSIPFFVYDKYSKEACFILLNGRQTNEVEALKVATKISS